ASRAAACRSRTARAWPASATRAGTRETSARGADRGVECIRGPSGVQSALSPPYGRLAMLSRILTPLVAMTLAANTAPADDPKSPTADEVKAAQERLGEYLKGIEGADRGRVNALTTDGVGETFPDHVLFSLVFSPYPVARAVPEPFKTGNVVAVPKKDGKPVVVTSTKELEEFVKKNARPVKTGDDAKNALQAWLRAAA